MNVIFKSCVRSLSLVTCILAVVVVISILCILLPIQRLRYCHHMQSLAFLRKSLILISVRLAVRVLVRSGLLCSPVGKQVFGSGARAHVKVR